MIKGHKDEIIEVKDQQQQILMEKHQNLLSKFGEESSILIKQLFDIEMQIDNQGFYIFRLQMEELPSELTKSKIYNSKKLIETCSEKKH